MAIHFVPPSLQGLFSMLSDGFSFRLSPVQHSCLLCWTHLGSRKSSLNLSPLLFQGGVQSHQCPQGGSGGTELPNTFRVALLLAPCLGFSHSLLQGRSALKWIKMYIWQGEGSGLCVQCVVQRADGWPKCLHCCCSSWDALSKTWRDQFGE